MPPTPNAGFSNLIYTITAPLVAPFQGVFPTPQSHGSILDLAAVLAIIVYALLTWGIARLFEFMRRRSMPTT
ncbi:MAG TPA: YggT family protein [Ktedonobacterales bacterium]|nr:YggT family protein [Ktedonobacterales bacterium]